MRIAILGASSQIAKDLILSFAAHAQHELLLFARQPERVASWQLEAGIPGHYPSADFSMFGNAVGLDAILNFVGVGDPARTARMGASILDVTMQYDDLALDYVRRHPRCRYLFLSSGAAFGSNFDQAVEADTHATVALNGLGAQDWYGVAKLYAECRHRALAELPIIDIRVFNYFSRTQDVSARFLICDILRAIRSGQVLQCGPGYMARDYLHPSDFFQLVTLLLAAPARNTAVDCYSKAPLDKLELLAAMHEQFGLAYQIAEAPAGMNATGSKPYYYSRNLLAAEFGYSPAFSSLECVVCEMQALLNLPSNDQKPA